MTDYPPPSPDYVGPAAQHGAANNKPIHRIVIHETQSPCEHGAARATGRYFRTTDRDASAHYIVDPGEVVQSVYDSVVAFHAPPNQHSLGVELCGFSDNNKARWRSSNRVAMRRRAQKLVAQLCLAYDVPPYFRSARQLRAGARGVTTHAQVSEAWHQTSHWDPGAWPRYLFMRGVRRNIKAIKAANKGKVKR